MKKGKRIWNKVLSLMLCLVMASGLFFGLGMEAKADDVYMSKEYDFMLTPENTGKDLYNLIMNNIINKNDYYKSYQAYSYIAKSGAQNALLSECENKTFSAGTYMLHCRTSNGYAEGNPNYIELWHLYRVNVTIGYMIGVNISGGAGSITYGGNTYNDGSFRVAENTGITFSVSEVTDYTPEVSFDGKKYNSSNGQYTISESDIKNASDRTIKVNYNLTNGSSITINQPSNATITFNGSTNSPQLVGKSGTYKISAQADDGYIIKTLYVDGINFNVSSDEKIEVDWSPESREHTITADVEKLELKVHNGSINLRDEMKPKEIAESVFNAIYDTSSNLKADISNLSVEFSNVVPSVSILVDINRDDIMLPYGYSDMVDFTAYLGDDHKERVQLSLSMPNGVTYKSEKVTVNINRIEISAKRNLEKVYDGTPFALSTVLSENNDIQWEYSIGDMESLDIVGWYDSDKKPLAVEPVDAGNYYLKVKTTDSLGSNISDFIPYKINKCPITITAQNQEIVYGNEIISNQNAVTVQGLLGGHNLTCAITQNTENVTTEGILTVEDVQIKSGNKDVTSNYQITTTSGKLMIKKIPQENLTILLPEGEIEYNGEEHKPLVIKIGNKTLTDNQDYKAVYSDNTKAGTATVTVTSSNWDGPITRTFKIVPKKITAAIINADEIYDGTSIAENAIIQLNGIVGADDISVTSTISYADANAGESKKVTATNVQLTGSDAANYQLVDESGQPTKTLNGIGTISKRPITISAGNKNKAYGENDPELTWKVSSDMKVVEGEKLSGIQISRDEGEGVGEYQISVSQSVDANSNYDITFKNAKLAIGQKELTVIVKVDDKQYDDLVNASYSATLEGVVNNEEVTLNCENVTASFAQTAADEDIAVSLTGDFGLNGTDELLKNYKLTQPAKIGYTADIYNHYNASEYEVKPNSWTNESVSITAADGYLIALDNKNDSQWTTVLTYSDETELEGEKVTFYVRNDSKKWISLPETVTYYIDKTAPSGTIIIAENEFKTFLETITFGKFFSKTQTVIIEAEDSLSGIAQVEYYESAEGLTASQIENLPEGFWTEGKRVSVTLEDAKKFVYYARITDKAGNQICISSDGNVYDITNPAITGVVNGETYYTSQMVNVSDVNLETVTFNGETVTITDGKVEPIELKGNVNETYTIVATDKAGNTTEVTVTMKTISSLSDQLADITEENVTSDDVENIDEIQKIIADENQSNATETEKELLKKLLEKCDNLEKTLEKTKEVVKDAKDVVHKVTEGNVTLNEDAELKKAKDNLENILEKNKGNLTAKEQEEIQKTIDNLDAIIEVIDEVKDAVKAIKVAKSTDGEYGVPDNEAAVSAYERAKDGYDRLTEEQKAMLGLDVKKALKEAKAAITNYKMIEGNGKIWVHNTNGTVTFVGNGLVRKLKNVIIDGKVFSTENYHVSKGSTVVEVDAAALYRLGLGDHIFQMEYEDGKTDVVEFSIVTMEEWNAMSNQQSGSNKTGGVATGDNADILLWGAALILGAAGLVVANKKRKNEKA